MKRTDGGSQRSGRRTKLERVIEKYGLQGFGEELENRWLGRDSYERESLRALARMTNRRILRAALEDVGESPLDGEVENLERLMTSNDVSAGMRSQTRQRLGQWGIDVDQLDSDFVSHQAVHTYLTSVRETDYHEATADGDKLLDRMETIQRLKSRLQAVTQSTIEKLRTAGELTIGRFEVLVSVQVICNECGGQYAVRELVENGGCDC